ncbi:hypothetical protein HZH68_000182 [Vespula germanica]|uniref:Uncharacterized protein n=1 Tax=Vespula germanica TaxID=30212 RepID=A0A834U5H5_VESGE|nr:hypothetical protein HZH68_000182 [Vespula germanica]
MSVKGVVSSVKNRERVSGSTFWRHSWHCSAYLPREVALARLTDSQLPTQQARSLENMIRAKIDKNISVFSSYSFVLVLFFAFNYSIKLQPRFETIE